MPVALGSSLRRLYARLVITALRPVLCAPIADGAGGFTVPRAGVYFLPWRGPRDELPVAGIGHDGRLVTEHPVLVAHGPAALLATTLDLWGRIESTRPGARTRPMPRQRPVGEVPVPAPALPPRPADVPARFVS